MQVAHTAGVPPNLGSSILATIGSTRNSRVALANSVTVKTMTGLASKRRTRTEHLEESTSGLQTYPPIIRAANRYASSGREIGGERDVDPRCGRYPQLMICFR